MLAYSVTSLVRRDRYLGLDFERVTGPEIALVLVVSPTCAARGISYQCSCHFPHAGGRAEIPAAVRALPRGIRRSGLGERWSKTLCVAGYSRASQGPTGHRSLTGAFGWTKRDPDSNVRRSRVADRRPGEPYQPIWESGLRVSRMPPYSHSVDEPVTLHSIGHSGPSFLCQTGTFNPPRSVLGLLTLWLGGQSELKEAARLPGSSAIPGRG